MSKNIKIKSYKHIMRRIYLVYFLFLFLPLIFSACSEENSPEPQQNPTFTESLQTILDDGIQTFNGKGVSAAVIMPDGEI